MKFDAMMLGLSQNSIVRLEMYCKYKYELIEKLKGKVGGASFKRTA